MTAGLGTANMTIPISDATAREITIVPTWRYSNSYPEAIRVAEASVLGTPLDGRMLPDISHLITHRFNGLDEVEDAFQTACSAGDAEGRLVVKTAVNFPSKI